MECIVPGTECHVAILLTPRTANCIHCMDIFRMIQNLKAGYIVIPIVNMTRRKRSNCLYYVNEYISCIHVYI